MDPGDNQPHCPQLEPIDGHDETFHRNRLQDVTEKHERFNLHGRIQLPLTITTSKGAYSEFHTSAFEVQALQDQASLASRVPRRKTFKLANLVSLSEAEDLLSCRLVSTLKTLEAFKNGSACAGDMTVERVSYLLDVTRESDKTIHFFTCELRFGTSPGVLHVFLQPLTAFFESSRHGKAVIPNIFQENLKFEVVQCRCPSSCTTRCRSGVRFWKQDSESRFAFR
ncbi:hypothetical protein SCHPADRAFT_911027 [Schizopora paradoxa]|uniref:Uncharacterized protein n=1 Tax=Schizopora paradoxa TaxID=27342 RepID=A0A0H2R111_9AGAM|nr:hypothetical protein SCHPADRAFT_911027 [Schizopora paradoxa]